jgi:hypothetical protein
MSQASVSITGTWSTITRWAAKEIACSPEEQNRFTVTPLVVTGRPARMAALRATLCPVAPSGNPHPKTTSSISPGSTRARFTASAMT